ncbi:MAG: helix-turn-helix transcriptional regulator [Bacteroidales bacterium]|nr:helix-turn-helix transcriptional regulator [Bacteroidales bacterium]
MLKYNINRVIKERGIDKPKKYLRQAGIYEAFALRIKNNQVHRINLPTIEKLCILLKCTPNDLMVWEADSNAESYKNHPLNIMMQGRKKIKDISNLLNSVPFEKLEGIEEMIKKEVGEE